MTKVNAYHPGAYKLKQMTIREAFFVMLEEPFRVHEGPLSPNRFCKIMCFTRLRDANDLLPRGAVILCLFFCCVPEIQTG